MDYQARSVLETPYGDIQSKYAYVSLRDYNRWFDDHPGGLMVLRLESQIGIIRYVSVAGPYNSSIQIEERNDDIIYLPDSIYHEFENAGSIMLKVDIVYDLEKATKIVLKPLDNAAYHQDMRELMESAMNEFPLLQKHTQFSVEVEALGGYVIDIWVEDIEPAEVVQLGGEVEVEFTEPLEEIVEFISPEVMATIAAPAVTALPVLEPDAVAASSCFQGMYFPEMTTPAPAPESAPIILPTAAEKDAMRAARLAKFSSYNRVN